MAVRRYTVAIVPKDGETPTNESVLAGFPDVGQEFDFGDDIGVVSDLLVFDCTDSIRDQWTFIVYVDYEPIQLAEPKQETWRDRPPLL
jgi:hypothetical protein